MGEAECDAELELMPAGPPRGELEQLGAHSSSGAPLPRSREAAPISECQTVGDSPATWTAFCVYGSKEFSMKQGFALKEAPSPTAPEP